MQDCETCRHMKVTDFGPPERQCHVGPSSVLCSLHGGGCRGWVDGAGREPEGTGRSRPRPIVAVEKVEPKRHPIKEVLKHYDVLFSARYGSRPDIGAKDAALAGQLIGKHGEDEVVRRLGQFFESDDPFFITAGHTFGVFRACWNKLIVLEAEPKIDYVSDISKQNLRNAEAAIRMLSGRQKAIGDGF